jgi:sugar-specific transcriptional regulator TrmB
MKDAIRLLRDLGLKEYEAAAYAALVEKGGVSAVEVADAAGIPRPRVYDVLKNLDRLGFLHVQDGTPTVYMPTPPAEAVEIARTRQMKEKEAKAAAGNELITAMEPLYRKAILPKDLSLNIRGEKNVGREIIKMVASAKRISVIVPTDPAPWAGNRAYRKKFGEKKLRVIAANGGGDDYDGVEIKIMPITSNAGVIIADERECLLLRGGEKDPTDGVLIRNSKIAAGFEQLFDLMWKSI